MLLVPVPLVLDLDGTVIRTDTFHEMMRCLLSQKPWLLLVLPFWFLKGRAYAKAQLVDRVHVNLDALPYNKQLLAFAKKEERPLILATGTDQRLAQKIADHLGIFQETIGSDGTVNMTGPQKGQALVARFGAQGFDYAGDSLIDEAVWQLSRKAFVVCPKRGVLEKALALKIPDDVHHFPREGTRAWALVLALRPLFWVFSLGIGLSLLSSGLLILNDLLLVEKERTPLCQRPSVFAEGQLHLITAFILAPLLIISSLPFLFASPVSMIALGGYILLFLGLDRLTRPASLPLRWIILGLFQVSSALLIPLAQ